MDIFAFGYNDFDVKEYENDDIGAFTVIFISTDKGNFTWFSVSYDELREIARKIESFLASKAGGISVK